MESFELYIFSFGLFSFDLCSVAARFLICSELLLGLGLVSGLWRKTVNYLCALMLGGFSIFLVWRLAVGDEGSCHCFGDVLDMNPWQSLIKNAVFAALLAGGWNYKLPAFMDKVSKKIWLLVTILLSVACFATVFIVNPPDMVVRWRTGSSDYLVMDKWEQYAEEADVVDDGDHRVVLFLSPYCEHCQHCAAKLTRMIERHDLYTGDFFIVFMYPYDEEGHDMAPLEEAFFEGAGVEDLGIPRLYLSYLEFIPLTRGLQPLVCLFDGTTKVAEYDGLTLDENFLVEFLSEE